MKSTVLLIVFLITASSLFCYSQTEARKIEHRDWYLMTDVHSEKFFSTDSLLFEYCDSCSFYDSINLRQKIRFVPNFSTVKYRPRSKFNNEFTYNYDAHFDTINGMYGLQSMGSVGFYRFQEKENGLFIKLKVIDDLWRPSRKNVYKYEAIIKDNQLILIKND